MAAGAGGDPAAERRELEGLREVAQREPVRAQLVLEAGPGRAGLDPRRHARRGRSRARGRAGAGRSTPSPRSSPTAARRRPPRSCRRRRDRGGASAPRTSSAPPRSPLVARGGPRGRAGGRIDRGSRARCRGRTCPGVRGALVGLVGTDRRERRGRRSRGARSSTASSGTGDSTSAPKPRRARMPAAPPAALRGRAAGPRSPSPSASAASAEDALMVKAEFEGAGGEPGDGDPGAGAAFPVGHPRDAVDPVRGISARTVPRSSSCIFEFAADRGGFLPDRVFRSPDRQLMGLRDGGRREQGRPAARRYPPRARLIILLVNETAGSKGGRADTRIALRRHRQRRRCCPRRWPSLP